MDETIELRTIFGLLQRQFRLIAVTVLLVVAAAALIAFSLTPIYSSSALILVDPARKDLLDPETQGFTIHLPKGTSRRILVNPLSQATQDILSSLPVERKQVYMDAMQ